MIFRGQVNGCHAGFICRRAGSDSQARYQVYAGVRLGPDGRGEDAGRLLPLRKQPGAPGPYLPARLGHVEGAGRRAKGEVWPPFRPRRLEARDE